MLGQSSASTSQVVASIGREADRVREVHPMYKGLACFHFGTDAALPMGHAGNAVACIAVASCQEGPCTFRPAPPGRPQVLQVRSCLAGSHASEQLQPGDLVLAVGGTPLSSFPALDDLLDGLSATAAAAPLARDPPACPRVPALRCAARWGF